MDMDVDMDMFVTKTERDIRILSDSWIMNISTVLKLQICFIPCEMPFKTIPYNLLRQVSHILDSWKARHKHTAEACELQAFQQENSYSRGFTQCT